MTAGGVQHVPMGMTRVEGFASVVLTAAICCPFLFERMEFDVQPVPTVDSVLNLVREQCGLPTVDVPKPDVRVQFVEVEPRPPGSELRISLVNLSRTGARVPCMAMGVQCA